MIKYGQQSLASVLLNRRSKKSKGRLTSESKTFGESERGMINALCDDIVHAPDFSRLRGCLSGMRFQIDQFLSKGPLKSAPDQDLPSWRMKQTGFLLWRVVEEKTRDWPQTSQAFAWSYEQVFGVRSRVDSD
jgi:hypothetical protein